MSNNGLKKPNKALILNILIFAILAYVLIMITTFINEVVTLEFCMQEYKIVFFEYINYFLGK